MGRFPAGRLADLRAMQIVRLLFIALALFTASQAFAEDTPPRIHYGFPSSGYGLYDSVAQACAAYQPGSGRTWLPDPGPPPRCVWSAGGGTQGLQITYSCPAGSSPIGTGANTLCRYPTSCPPTQIRNTTTGACEDPPIICEDGCKGACGTYRTFDKLRTLACIDRCIYRVGGGLEVVLTNGSSSASQRIGVQTAATCTINDPSPVEPTPCPECECRKQGKSYGTVNGAVVCVTPGTPGSPEVKKQDEPIKTTTTPAPTPENPNPSPVTTETPSPVITITPPPVGSPAGTPPTVTETKTNSDGSSEATNQSKDSYCTANPNSPMCKDEDASRFCEENPDVLACQKLGEAPDLIPLEVKEVNIGSMILRELPSDNSCPAPLTTTIYGHTISLSFDPLCQYASTFKPLVLSLAWLSAAFIVVGYRKDS